MTKPVTKAPTAAIKAADIQDSTQAHRLMQVAMRFVAAGQDTVRDVERNGTGGFDRHFLTAARSALDSAARWIRETNAILPPQAGGSQPLSAYQRDKTFASFKQAKTTMELVQKLGGENTGVVNDLTSAARQVLTTTAKTVGEVAGGVADAAGGAAGSLLWGLLKGLGVGGVVTVAAVIGVVVIAKGKVL